MREKYLWIVITVLTVLSLGQACYIYEETAAAGESSGPSPLRQGIERTAYSEKASDAQWEEFQKWRGSIQGRLDSGTPLLEPDFDAFFNDNYFTGRREPFAEMERIRGRMGGLVGEAGKPLFDGYWDKWFEQRMQMGQFKTEIIRAGTEMTLTILVPGLRSETTDVDITPDRIRVSFSVSASSGKSNGDGAVVREAARKYIKILPVPEDADAASGQAEITGDRIRIGFKQKGAKN